MRAAQVHFPVDYVTADRFASDAEVGHATDDDGIPDNWMARRGALRAARAMAAGG